MTMFFKIPETFGSICCYLLSQDFVNGEFIPSGQHKAKSTSPDDNFIVCNTLIWLLINLRK